MAEMLLTVEQAAERLQLHPESVRRQIRRGVLRGIKRGRVLRIPESAIVENAVTIPATASQEYTAPVSTAQPQELQSATPRPTAQEIARRRAELDALERLFEEQNAEAAAAEVMAQFAPPTAADIKRRLKALNQLGHRAPDRQGLPPLTDDAARQGYDERIPN